MPSVETERNRFFETLQNELNLMGNPFIFKSSSFWATINKSSSNAQEPCIAIDFLVNEGYLRINLYIANDLELYELLEKRRDEIDDALYLPVKWSKGEKNPNTRRIKIELPFFPYDYDYKKLVNRAIPIIMKFIETFKCYI